MNCCAKCMCFLYLTSSSAMLRLALSVPASSRVGVSTKYQLVVGCLILSCSQYGTAVSCHRCYLIVLSPLEYWYHLGRDVRIVVLCVDILTRTVLLPWSGRVCLIFTAER